MYKTIITIIIIIIAAGLGYWIYQSSEPLVPKESIIEQEQACLDAGGQVSISLCCKSASDFPNSCLIGPCGCSPDNSHQVKVCDCGPDKCFNRNKCVSLDNVSVLLEDLKRETNIDFSNIESVEFQWVVKVDPKIQEINIQGERFNVERISDEQYRNIESFLKNRGFEVDVYNMAAGTISGLTGYQKDQLVCVVIEGATGYKEAEGQWVPLEPDKKDVEIRCGKLEMTIDVTANWNKYTNEKYGYSFKYPVDCLYGPLPGYCKQSPPEERSRECLCYLNAENSDDVSLGTFTGPKDNLTGVSFGVFHSVFVDSYSPPVGTNLINWLKEKFSYQEIPDEINMAIDEIPAVKVYTPQSPMAFSQEDIYFIKDDNLFKISMLDVDNGDNKALYSQILSTFEFIKMESE